MAPARLPAWPEIMVADLAQVGKANPCGMLAHGLEDACDRRHFKIVSIVISVVNLPFHGAPLVDGCDLCHPLLPGHATVD
jgi:hypothetical protein